MDTLEELEYYCNEINPAGALLLTGEWGSGKTYFLEHELRGRLEKNHILVRISLFGMDSIERIHEDIKKKWFYSFMALETPISGVMDVFKNYGRLIQKISKLSSGKVGTIINSVCSSDVLDFVKIEPRIGDNRVVLIFDDLERSNLSVLDLLGCINEYCENLHFNTIVVANEEKIEEKDYHEVKEKLIKRTLQYCPNYADVISSVIDDFEVSDYQSFLKDNLENMITIFSGESLNEIAIDHVRLNRTMYSNVNVEEVLSQRPHNIRSLKCALQDFERIYRLLEKKGVHNKEKWLFSFISYVLCCKAGLIIENDGYGGLLATRNVSILYPGYYDGHRITNGIMDWIKNGVWSLDVIESEIDFIWKRDRNLDALDRIRKTKIFDMEEDDLKTGFPKLLEKAYAGELELDDYVHLVCNSAWAREYSIPLPSIDWNKVHNGIHKQIDFILNTGMDLPSYQMSIDKDDSFISEEWSAYELIKGFYNSEALLFRKNKILYIELMKEDPVDALIRTKNQRFDVFDKDMAVVTASGFEKISNADRDRFVNRFESMWVTIIDLKDYKAGSPEDGFGLLKERISEFYKRCDEEGLYIARSHANEFLRVINNLIDRMN